MKTRLNDLFDQMEPEKGNKLDDKIKIELENPEQLEHVFNVFDLITKNFEEPLKILNNQPGRDNVKIIDEITPYDISKNTITNFTSKIKKTNSEAIECLKGLYISSLINKSHQRDHLIIVDNLRYIGFENKKDISIIGNLSGAFGMFMKRGEVKINGNAKYNFCHGMTGGEVTLKGDATFCAGLCLNGGKITINGNAGSSAGRDMQNGEIRINGDIDSISQFISGGNIFHYDKQIVRNGTVLDESYLKK